jgi:hypothetical protein
LTEQNKAEPACPNCGKQQAECICNKQAPTPQKAGKQGAALPAEGAPPAAGKLPAADKPDQSNASDNFTPDEEDEEDFEDDEEIEEEEEERRERAIIYPNIPEGPQEEIDFDEPPPPSRQITPPKRPLLLRPLVILLIILNLIIIAAIIYFALKFSLSDNEPLKDSQTFLFDLVHSTNDLVG